MQVTPARSYCGKSPSTVKREGADVLANTASHECLLDAQAAKSRVGPTASASQIDSAAGVATPPTRVVLREALDLGLLLLGLRLRLLGLKAKTGVLALQRPDSLSQKGQVLAENRRRSMFVHQRLNLVEQGFKHYVALHLLGSGHRSGEAL